MTFCLQEGQEKLVYAGGKSLLWYHHWDVLRGLQSSSFHVRYNDYRAIINILTGEVEGKLPRRVLSMTFEWLDLHKDDLMNNWKRMENGEVAVEIKPLD